MCVYKLLCEPLCHLKQLVPVVPVYLRAFYSAMGNGSHPFCDFLKKIVCLFQQAKKLTQLRHLAKVTCKELGVASKVPEQFTL